MEDGQPRLSSSTALARALSVAGHPFLLVPLTVAALTRSLFWSAIIAASTVVPLLAIIARNVRRGRWSDFDVSRHEQRSGLYHYGLPLIAVCFALLWYLGAHPRLLRGVGAGGVMFAAALLGNRYLKISMHMMSAAFCAVMLTYIYPAFLVPIVAFTAAIAWSRRKLDRHTWSEILVGTLFGAITGLFSIW